METGQAYSFYSLDERHVAYYVDVPKANISIDVILKGHHAMCKDVLSREGHLDDIDAAQPLLGGCSVFDGQQPTWLFRLHPLCRALILVMPTYEAPEDRAGHEVRLVRTRDGEDLLATGPTNFDGDKHLRNEPRHRCGDGSEVVTTTLPKALAFVIRLDREERAKNKALRNLIRERNAYAEEQILRNAERAFAIGVRDGIDSNSSTSPRSAALALRKILEREQDV